MQYTFKLEQFEGPLELLLRLIEEEKLDITTVSLARVTDQYVSYIEHQEELPSDEVADFLVVAAKLIYLKSKYLLPQLVLEEEEEGESLEEQLKIFREYYQASKHVSRLIAKQRFSYARTTPLALPREQKFSPPPHLALADMAAAMRDVVGRLVTLAQLPKIVLKATISIKDKIASLKEAIRRGIIHFARMHNAGDKHDVIVSFLALLELVKMREISVSQGGLFTEIVIQQPTSHE